jgi:hypothetical protein
VEIKTIRSVCAAKLAEVIKSEESGAGLHDVKPFCFVQAHSFLRGVCIARTSVPVKAFLQ